jgi:hypothetical protein
VATPRVFPTPGFSGFRAGEAFGSCALKHEASTIIKSARKVAARNNATSKGSGKAREKHHNTAPTLAAQKVRRTSLATAPKVAARAVHNNHRNSAAHFEQFPAQLPDTFRVLAEKNVAQTRELYGRSKDTLQAVLASWQKSFGAAGQGVTALNLRIIDVAERHIDAVFDLATGLAGAKNFADVMASHATYCRKQISNLSTQAVRAPSTRTSRRPTERR